MMTINLVDFRLGFVDGVPVYRTIKAFETAHELDTCICCGKTEGNVGNKCVTCFSVIHHALDCSRVDVDGFSLICMRCVEKTAKEEQQKATERAI